MKNKAVKFFDATVHPGEQASLALPLPEMFTCAPMYMPIKVIHGKEAGPTVLIIAAMHGNEVNGTEIINKLRKKSELSELKGTLIMIPVMNVYGMTHRSRYMPDGAELDRSFPGSESGSHAARLTNLFTAEVLDKADYCIDLQTGALNHSNLPQIFADLSSTATSELAKAFATPVISNANIEEGSLRKVCQERSIPLLVYEAGEAMRFDQQAIEIGVRGVMNVLNTLGMLEQETNGSANEPVITRRSGWIRSPKSGIAKEVVGLGQKVSKNQKIAVIQDPFGAGDDTPVVSPKEGIIVSINNQPLIHEGEALFHLAMMPEVEEAETTIQEWQEQQEGQMQEEQKQEGSSKTDSQE